MDQATFGAVATLAGVAVGAASTWLREGWSDWRLRERHARYLAVRAVCILDSYVTACAEVVSDDGLCEGQRNEQDCLEAQISLPPAPNFPTDLDWKSIAPSLMYRLLSLSNEVETANRTIYFAAEAAGPPDYDFEERQHQYANLGLAAYALTQDLRDKYSIPARKLAGWSSSDYLVKAKDQIEGQRQKRAKIALATRPLI